MRCGVFVRIPVLDAPAAASVARAVPAAVGDAPKASVAGASTARGVRRPRRALAWIALFVVVVLVGAGLGAQAYLSLPPSTRSLERRLVTWDASGDGEVYRLLGFEEGADGQGSGFERIVDLDGDEFLLRNGERLLHRRGGEYYITQAPGHEGPYREPTVGRDGDEGNPFGAMPARVLNRTDRSYTGILGSQPFTLELDEQKRFQSLTYRNHRGDRVRLHYEYAEVRFPLFVRTSEAAESPSSTVRDDEIVYASLPRNAANFPLPEPGVAAARVQIDWNLDSRPSSDYLVRFKDAQGELMAETPMGNVALPGGFSFGFEDLNGNGLVDEGDAYAYEHPEGLSMEFYDVWARQPVGSPRREGPWDPQWDLVTPSWRLYSLRQSS